MNRLLGVGGRMKNLSGAGRPGALLENPRVEIGEIRIEESHGEGGAGAAEEGAGEERQGVFGAALDAGVAGEVVLDERVVGVEFEAVFEECFGLGDGAGSA